jgi:hypothetical protein
VLPELDGMIGGGIITLERVRVILYRDESTGADRDAWPSAGTAAERQADE